ncbi:ketopantoate reductase [Longilinea arvoryzae]|uniref:2-dehydropantoate 2-reductase n=1 Tax=Longilinea arvoryzae TaxID=360412 RepID=A0A0S7BJT6_9CHLR|nr:2-dehydropantoate 2-reductase [Longilinea arvoryzae]GAP14450.1 ketopantoate reductase [Longilinea arvoryzae]
MTPRLRFLVFGCGAIGTYLGGSLAASGQQVVFLERASVAPAIREQGLRVQTRSVELRVASPTLVENIQQALELERYDAAILAVKSFDTLELLQSVRAVADRLPPLICFQNGVENEPLIADFLGEKRVIYGTVTTAIGRRGLGNVVVEKLRGIGVANSQERVPGLLDALNQAGLRAQSYSNGPAMKWSKMLTNLQANSSSAILDLTPGEIFAHPGLFRLEMRMLREALLVMRAQGIPVVDLPRTPVRAFTALVQAPAVLSQPLLRRALGAGRGGKMPSFHIDLHQGRGRSEVDYLNGAVVRFGLRFGVPTPVNQFLNETLLALSEGRLALETYARRPEEFLKAAPSD